ncbi:olfactory receptor 143-like [Alexandromys fortis]|uniref:olfactory receptor 143-like n=1 Tax=Alexandromys fortis TaxID=100897 RepID=UPI0021522C24|nr:olfactory receptor 143-like [Microtus fortis]
MLLRRAMQHLTKTAMKNDSSVTEFILAGLTDRPELQLPLFILFLVYHTVTVVGNLSLMSLILLNSHLQTPMYFFLFNLSFIDLCYSFVFTPKTLMSFVSEKNIISFRGCMTQLFFYCFFAHSECYVLTAMAYDRYVAICQPLLYMVIMSPRTCSLMMFGSYLTGFTAAIVHIVFMIRLNFCNSNIINHYLCDIFPLLQLSCSNIYATELVSSVVASTVVIVSSVIILMSYALILFNITQLSSGKGLYKAMSTCSSHIITVALFYGFGMLTHIKTSSDESVVQGKILSVFCTFLLPLLNPFIYSLRNKDVKLALKTSLRRLKVNEALRMS